MTTPQEPNENLLELYRAIWLSLDPESDEWLYFTNQLQDELRISRLLNDPDLEPIAREALIYGRELVSKEEAALIGIDITKTWIIEQIEQMGLATVRSHRRSLEEWEDFLALQEEAAGLEGRLVSLAPQYHAADEWEAQTLLTLQDWAKGGSLARPTIAPSPVFALLESLQEWMESGPKKPFVQAALALHSRTGQLDQIIKGASS